MDLNRLHGLCHVELSMQDESVPHVDRRVRRDDALHVAQGHDPQHHLGVAAARDLLQLDQLQDVCDDGRVRQARQFLHGAEGLLAQSSLRA